MTPTPILDYPSLAVDMLTFCTVSAALGWIGGVVLARIEREIFPTPARVEAPVEPPTRLHIATETSDEAHCCEVCHVPLHTLHVVRLWNGVARACDDCAALLVGRAA